MTRSFEQSPAGAPAPLIGIDIEGEELARPAGVGGGPNAGEAHHSAALMLGDEDGAPVSPASECRGPAGGPVR